MVRQVAKLLCLMYGIPLYLLTGRGERAIWTNQEIFVEFLDGPPDVGLSRAGAGMPHEHPPQGR